MTEIEKIDSLVEQLNHYRDLYYNLNRSEISDLEYDRLFDELKTLEEETGYFPENSPTQEVGYQVVSKLLKKTHNHPMLSLDKTKSVSEIKKFLGGRTAVCMAKLDGLTVSLHYVHGKLVEAETRGNGEVGELITHNAMVIDSIPKLIPTFEKDVVVDGEVICTTDEFEKMNSGLPEEKRYSCPRNFAAGSVRQLDPEVCESRHLTFVAWKLISGSHSNSFIEQWRELQKFGFFTVPLVPIKENATEQDLTFFIDGIKDWSARKNYPIDGCVFGFDDVEYGESLGMTSHHIRSQMAFKFYDDLYPTILRDIRWTIGKTGTLTPTAIFDPVQIDGTTITCASLHNVSIMKSLALTKNCTIYIYKANEIIPQVDSCDPDGDEEFAIPTVCPICGMPTEIQNENGSETLCCTNEDCVGKQQKKFENFVSRNCANIEGLSEATISLFLSLGYIHNYRDLYHLKDYAEEIKALDGFGEGSVNKLLNAIEKSRNIKLENYINAIGIDGIGKANAKVISKYFHGNYDEFITAVKNRFDFQQLEGFGLALHMAIRRWYDTDKLCEGLSDEFVFESEEVSSDNSLAGLRFCITGSFSESRDVLKAKLESKGAIFVSGVSKKLDILFAGENAGSKLQKATELGVKIANESELLQMIS